MSRPAMPDDAPAGHHWEASSDGSLDWRVIEGFAPIVSKTCRSGRPSCGKPAVAELNRGRKMTGQRYGQQPRQARTLDSWWAYCGEHLYGRWIEDGEVMGWKLVEDGVLPLDTKPASSFLAYDHTRSLWAVAAEFWLRQALDDVASGYDALPSVSAAQACLEIEARERPVDPDLLDGLLEMVPDGWRE